MTTSTRSRSAVQKVIVHESPGTKMKGCGSKLSDEETDELTAFVKSL